MSWLTSPILALDAESTGTDPETARVVTYCLGRSDRPGQWEPVESWMIDPGCPIPAEATAVHGITDEMAAEGDTPELALGQLEVELRGAAFSQVPIVLHNAPYDLTLLDREFRRHMGVGIPDGLIILDTLVLFRRFELTTGSRTLAKLAERHGIVFPAHDAEADALAALRLLHILAGINDLLPLVDVADLHRLQSDWYAAQQSAAYWRRVGNGDHGGTLTKEWPVHTYHEGVGA